MINTLPQDVLKSVLFHLSPQDIPTVCQVNKLLNSEITREGFWKELCLYKYYSSNDCKKGEKESWREHANTLDKAVKWTDYHSSLRVNNKGYTITNIRSNIKFANSSSPSPSSPSVTVSLPSLCIGVAEKPLVAGPFSGRYFEVTIDDLPESNETLQIVVGVAPANILDNPALEKVMGYGNNGKVHERGFGKEYGLGDTIGVLLNTEYMTLSFFKNNDLQGTPFAHLDKSIPWHPVVVLLYQGCQVTIPLPPRKEAPHMPLR